MKIVAHEEYSRKGGRYMRDTGGDAMREKEQLNCGDFGWLRRMGSQTREARTSFLQFVKTTMPRYRDRWFHRVLCGCLDKVYAGEIPRLMVFMPPQHGKSELTSRRFPAYALGRNPDLKIAACAFSADLARKFNREVRRIVAGPRYRAIFKDTVLPNRKRAKGAWSKTRDEFEIPGFTGSYKAVGVMGSLTGSQIDVGLIDDPIKNSVEAQSLTWRDRLWEWWTDVFFTRLNNDSRVVFTCTRWHEDDLAGRILAREPENWKIFLLPGIREECGFANMYPAESLLAIDDPREVGEALWPARHSCDKALALKKSSGRTFAAMIQQRPAATEGNIFKKKWFRYYDSLPVIDRIVQSWDCTFEGGENNDYVACTVWGMSGAQAYLLKMVRGKWDIGETIEQIRRLSGKYHGSVETCIERKANGSAIISLLQREIPGIIPIDVQDSKEARAYACSFLFEAGNVFFPKDKEWAQETIDELAAFPHGRYDDIVDTVSQALNRLYGHPMGRAMLVAI